MSAAWIAGPDATETTRVPVREWRDGCEILQPHRLVCRHSAFRQCLCHTQHLQVGFYGHMPRRLNASRVAEIPNPCSNNLLCDTLAGLAIGTARMPGGRLMERPAYR